MSARLGVRVNVHSARPELLSPHPGEVDRRGAIHPWRLRSVGIQLIPGDDPNTGMLPSIFRNGGRRIAHWAALLTWIDGSKFTQNR